MKSFCFTILTLVVLAQAEDGKAKEKRGVAESPTYSSFSNRPSYSNGPSYTKTPQSSPAQQEYVSQTQQYYQADTQIPQSQAVTYAQPTASEYSVPQKVTKTPQSSPAQQEYVSQTQQYYQADTQVPQSQAVTYAQPAVSKYSVPQKVSFVPQLQQHQPIQYSSAADVSSFSYSSPVVAYNNLGLLQQLAGNAASSQDRPVSYTTSNAPKEQYPSPQYSSAQKVQYVSSPKTQYVSAPKTQYITAPKGQYSSAPLVQYQSPQKVQYSSSPNAYSGAPNYEELYQQISQEAAAYSSAAAAEHQGVSYQPNTAGQREEYAQVPAPVAYQTKTASHQSASHQTAFAPSPPQRYSFQAPQVHRNQVPQVTPVYESSAQSAPKVYYTKSASEVPQYFSLPSQTRYSKPGVTYA